VKWAVRRENTQELITWSDPVCCYRKSSGHHDRSGVTELPGL